MVVCKNYKYGYTKEENNEIFTYIFVELYTGTTPSTLPTNAVGIENFPQNYTADNVKFAAGSTLYCATSGDIFITDENGVWKAQ